MIRQLRRLWDLKSIKYWLPTDLVAITMIGGEMWYRFVRNDNGDHIYPSGDKTSEGTYWYFSFHCPILCVWAFLGVWYNLFPGKAHLGTSLVLLAYMLADWAVFAYCGSQQYQALVYFITAICFYINGRAISRILSARV